MPDMATVGTGLKRAIACSNCISRLPQPSTRAFTTSPSLQKHGSLATFKPTSSPELDALLSTFRSTVFLPAHLIKYHQSLIYKAKHRPTLLSEPVYIDIGTEKCQLLPIDRVKDRRPGKQRGFARLLDLMRDARHWDNLPPFLEELRIARRHLSDAELEKMVRRAHDAGRWDVVLACVARVERTGLVLRDVRLVREVMWGAHLRATRSAAGWAAAASAADAKQAERDELARALKHAEAVAHHLESPLHLGKLRLDRDDPRARPEIIGVLLELAALRAAKRMNGEDADGKVRRYAERVMATWQNAAFTDFSTQENAADWVGANYEMQVWAPVWKGMEVAAGILDSNTKLAAMVKRKVPLLERYLREAEGVVRANSDGETTRRGVQWFEELQRV